MIVTRSGLIEKLAQSYSQLVLQDTEYATKIILAAMSQALLNGRRVEIRGFGTFDLTYRPPRVGRNPRSGETVFVPAKLAPHCRAGKELRGRVFGIAAGGGKAGL